MARVINIADSAKFPGAVYIGRAGEGQDGYFGNPFRVGTDGDRKQVLEKYEAYFRKRLSDDPAFWYRVKGLSGKTLVCFCKPLACHGDVIATYLEQRFGDPNDEAEEMFLRPIK